MTELNKAIINAINFEENITVLGVHDDGLYEIFDSIITNQDINERFQENTKKNIIFKRLGLKLNEEIETYSENQGIFKLFEEELSNNHFSIENISENDTVVFIIEDIDKLENPIKIISILDQLFKQYRGKILFAYLLQDVEVFVNLQLNLDSDSTFFDNIIYQNLISEREQEYLEWFCKTKYGDIKNQKIKDSIYQKVQGHYELYKKLYKKELIKDSETLEKYIKRLLRDMGDKSLKAFYKTENNIELNADEAQLMEEYQKLGFINAKGKLVIPLLSDYLYSITPQEELFFDNKSKQLKFPSSSHFSSSELNILTFLYQNLGKLCKRDDLARTIWSVAEIEEKYSNWAIDQAVFRLRKKLEKYNIDAKIETVHKKGFIMR